MTTIAGNWMRLARALGDAGIDLSPEHAARWAGLGFLPEEAGQLILDGVTAERYAEMEERAERQAGGPDALAAQRIAELRATGILVDEDRVIRIPDPTDPSREIVALLDDPS